MSAPDPIMTTSAEPTLQHTIQSNIAAHETSETPPEIRVYKIKAIRPLASGELKEYITEVRYLPKKKPGPSQTAINKLLQNKRSEITRRLRDLTYEQLHQVEILFQQLNMATVELPAEPISL